MKSDLFIECAKSVVEFYNLTQESIGSKNRMEYPVVKEVKPREIYIHHHKWCIDAPKVARDKDDICFNCKCKPTLYREVTNE